MQVFEWFKTFRGRETIKDDPHFGKFSMLKTNENI